MALGTGTVTVDRTGRLEIGVTGGIADILVATMPTICLLDTSRCV